MAQIKIGWGRREISLNETVMIPGQMYMRISQGIMDPLYATALCLEDGTGEQVIFCSCDLGNFNTGIIKGALDKIHELRPELPVDRVILNCTHTHCCPNTRETPEKSPDGIPIYPGYKYREFFEKQCAEAVIEAWDNRKEGAYCYGYGYAVVAHSRRSIYFKDMSDEQEVPVSPNGYGIMYGRTNRPEFSSYEAGADHFLNALYTFDSEEHLTGMIVNVPCPSQLSEHFSVQTADYWGDVRALAKKEFGPDVYVLTQCAAAGDLSPRILHYKEAQCRRMRLKYNLEYEPSAGFADHNKAMGERYDIAERIVDGLKEIYSWAKKDVIKEAPLRVKRVQASLASRPVYKEERDWCAENLEKLKSRIPDPSTSTPEQYRKAITNYESIRTRNENAVREYETQKPDAKEDSLIFAVQLGDIAFATNRYELYMDYMHRIQARSPFIQTFVVQLAGEEYGGYLATERGVYNRGYSASLFDNWVSPEGGQELVEATLDALNELYEKE